MLTLVTRARFLQELPDTKLNELIGQEFPCKVGDFGISPGDTLHVLAGALVRSLFCCLAAADFL